MGSASDLGALGFCRGLRHVGLGVGADVSSAPLSRMMQAGTGEGERGSEGAYADIQSRRHRPHSLGPARSRPHVLAIHLHSPNQRLADARLGHDHQQHRAAEVPYVLAQR